MGIFVAKMLTILGFVFYAGGPIDALQLAFMGNAGAGHLGVACDGCERTAASVAMRVQTAVLLRPSIGGVPVAVDGLSREAAAQVSGSHEGTQ